MPFGFVFVADLFERLHMNLRVKPGRRPSSELVREWFDTHQTTFERSEFGIVALLSTLLPDKRTDRVYGIQEASLERLVGRALGLGQSRISELGRWRSPGSGLDLADCVERLLTSTPNATREVSIEEIDTSLDELASLCQFSSPALRSRRVVNDHTSRLAVVTQFYTALGAREAKWLTRLILKQLDFIQIRADDVYRAVHPLLRVVLKVQDNLATAGETISRHRREYGTHSSAASNDALLSVLRPTLGVKVGRQPWHKARSIKHCLKMSHGRMSCQEKMDGEYAQIHIDLSRGYNCIQIFSKSGKDSTQERLALHRPIRESLQLGRASCPIKRGCILEGELVAFSDKEGEILGFHEIRKHINRPDWLSVASPYTRGPDWEHLMIVYYDVLMIDDESLLGARQSQRFQRLQHLVTCIPGRSSLVKHYAIDSAMASAASDLVRVFAKCIATRGEGLVLKADDPYIDLNFSSGMYKSCAIKLKRGYIDKFGEVGDFAVVGGRYDAASAKRYDFPNVKVTHLYIGCLDNREEASGPDVLPRVFLTNVIELNATQLQYFTVFCNPELLSPSQDGPVRFSNTAELENTKKPSLIFGDPLVFEIKSFGYARQAQTGFCTPRFPVVTKIHSDRTWRDAITFGELQELARIDTEIPQEEDGDEISRWISALMEVDAEQHGFVGTSQSTGSNGREPSSASGDRGPESIAVAPSLAEVRAQGSTSERLADTVPPQVCRPSPDSPRGEQSPSQHIVEHRIQDTSSSLEEVTNPSASIMQDDRPCSGPVGILPRPGSKVLPYFPEPVESTATRIEARRDKDSSLAQSNPISVDTTHGPSSLTRARDAVPSPRNRRYISATKDAALQPFTGRCRHRPDSCALSGISLMLGPAVSDPAGLTGKILRRHGVVDFAITPESWLQDARKATGQSPIASSGTGSKSPPGSRKVVLVESRDTNTMKLFLDSIETASFDKPSGSRQYAQVYDWRVLEALTRAEAESQRGVTSDPGRIHKIWRRFWVGAVRWH